MLERLWEATGVGSALAWSPTGHHLVCTIRSEHHVDEQPKERITLRAAATGVMLAQFTAACSPVLAVACSPTGDRVAAAGNEAGEVEIWHASGEQLLIYRDHPYRVHTLAWSPDGTHIASAGSELRVWDSTTGETRAYWLYWCSALAWSPDGRQLALACTDQVVRVLDLRSRDVLLSYSGHQTALRDEAVDSEDAAWQGGEIEQLSWSPDGRWLASVWVGEVHLWDAATGTCLHVRRGHPLQHWRFSWKPDEAPSPVSKLAINILEGTIFSDERLEPGAILQAAWSPDGTHLAATSSDSRLIVWQAV